jgi:2-polyprenyl-3-methyl-5-hydroxy-6-metoxy-1,4-benzoquinol methylase
MYMTKFEYFYLSLEPFFPPLQQDVRARLRTFASSSATRLEILDVGGRLSNYTIGVPANITITDIERTTAVQKQLHLGTNDGMMERLAKRRSNVTNIKYDNMTESKLPSESYDCVVAVEVLEHVLEDEMFVAQVKRVLKPGQTFLMTTPNGEFVENINPDHKRHYTREQLADLLRQHFEEVHVEYAVKTGFFYNLALRSWSWKHPIRTAVTMFAGLMSSIESRAPQVKAKHDGTHQLIAWARTKAQ